MLTLAHQVKYILIADDEPTLLFFLQQDLQQADFACQVHTANTGDEALQHLRQRRYDLLVSDLRMPGLNGLQLIEAARALHPHICTILMTAYGSTELQAEANRLRVDGYLSKPFSTATLKDMAVNILLRPGAASQTSVETTHP
jgi:YesN/AraC family two-component response regulator